jgi:hypothetical protein
MLNRFNGLLFCTLPRLIAVELGANYGDNN